MKITAYTCLLLASVAVRKGYLALMGPIAPGDHVWWTAMIGPFVVGVITLMAVQVVSPRGFSSIVRVTCIYALVVSEVGMLIAAVLYAGKTDQGQNHSDYALFFLPLWFVSVLPSPVLVGVAAWKRFQRKEPNHSTEPLSPSLGGSS